MATVSTPAQKIAARIRSARRAWMLTDADVARLSALPLETVKLAEHSASVEPGDLAAIASVLGSSLDDLLSGTESWLAPSVALRTSDVAVDIPLLRSALTRVSAAAVDAKGLRALLGQSDRWAARPEALAPCSVRGPVTKQAEDLAHQTRQALGLGGEPILDIRVVADRVGIETFLFDGGPDGVDGLMWRHANGAASIAANVSARGGKSTAIRATFAHELCHALFDGTRGASLGIVEKRHEADASGAEQRANAFAAYFLAPRATLQRTLHETGLASTSKPSPQHLLLLCDRFTIGAEMMAWHLVNCGRWDTSDVQRHRGVFAHDVRSPESIERDRWDEVPLERRRDVLRMATIALTERRISVPRWCELLRIYDSGAATSLLSRLEPAFDPEYRASPQ